MNRIFFVRHAEGQENVAGHFSSTWMDHSLTEHGRLQAMQTGEYLTGKPIDGRFCSPMKRTYETAQMIAKQLELEFIVLDEFQEVNVGALEGKDFTDENWRVYHKVTNQWYAGNAHACFTGGEDYETVWKRVRRGYERILQNHENRNFVIAGHGGIFAATLKEFVPGLEMRWLQNVAYYNCAITELEMEIANGELKGKIINWASTHHLHGEALSTLPAIPPLSSIEST